MLFISLSSNQFTLKNSDILLKSSYNTTPKKTKCLGESFLAQRLRGKRRLISFKYQYNTAEFAKYVVNYTKYPDISSTKMASIDCEICNFIELSKKKCSKTAGFWR